MALFFALLIMILLIAFLGKSDKKTTASAIHPKEKSPEGFTFFNLDKNTELTKEIRDALENQLGSDAVEKWGTLDIDTNYKGFLKKYFPELDELNQKLNYPPRERVEHNIIKLMYRYAKRKNAPFDYVELIFSNRSKTPLLFRIKLKKEGAIIIDTLKDKYGEPKTFDWVENPGKSVYWKKDREVLIVSIVEDRFGDPEFHIAIYFVGNIETLLDMEKKEIIRREEEIKKKGKTAF